MSEMPWNTAAAQPGMDAEEPEFEYQVDVTRERVGPRSIAGHDGEEMRTSFTAYPKGGSLTDGGGVLEIWTVETDAIPLLEEQERWDRDFAALIGETLFGEQGNKLQQILLGHPALKDSLAEFEQAARDTSVLEVRMSMSTVQQAGQATTTSSPDGAGGGVASSATISTGELREIFSSRMTILSIEDGVGDLLALPASCR
jgi:hypothetical protein